MNRLNQLNHNALEGRIVYLFALVVFLQTVYAFTSNDQPMTLIPYQLAYTSMLVGCVILAKGNRRLQIVLAVVGLCWSIAGWFYAFNPTMAWANLVAYGCLIVFQMLVIYVLLSYVFTSRVVTVDVILSACTVYLLLGALFTSIYGVLETLAWFSAEPHHAFVDGLNEYPNEPFPWQTLVYYSYATLTTLGYGDVLPATRVARSVASAEAVAGVLYLAILMARLVGLYAATEVEEEMGAG